MNAISIAAVLTAAALVAGSVTAAQGQDTTDPHHPSGAGSSQTSPSSPQAPALDTQSGMMGAMPMAQMMNMMAMGCMAMTGGQAMGVPDHGGRAMIDHIDGRVAFLRAELKITEQQATAWGDVENALRANARLLKEAHSATAETASSQATLERRLDVQTRLLSARLEGAQAISTALSGLYRALSPEQQKLADELIGAQLGLWSGGMVPMGMMMQPNGATP